LKGKTNVGVKAGYINRGGCAIRENWGKFTSHKLTLDNIHMKKKIEAEPASRGKNGGAGFKTKAKGPTKTS